MGDHHRVDGERRLAVVDEHERAVDPQRREDVFARDVVAYRPSLGDEHARAGDGHLPAPGGGVRPETVRHSDHGLAPVGDECERCGLLRESVLVLGVVELRESRAGTELEDGE